MTRSKLPFRPRSNVLALEPRVLFDGAGAVAATDVFDHRDSSVQQSPQVEPVMVPTAAPVDEPVRVAAEPSAQAAPTDSAGVSEPTAEMPSSSTVSRSSDSGAVSGFVSADDEASSPEASDSTASDALPAASAADADKSTGSDAGASEPPDDSAMDLDAGRETGPARTLVIIDARVADQQTLLADLPSNATVRVVDSNESGIAAVSDALASGGTYNAIHIVSHGSAGSLTLGKDTINSASLSRQSDALQSWSDYLTDDADILLYGCDVAEGETGQTFIGELARLTGADVAASDDDTGAADQGGDWVLEAATGSIEAQAFAAAGYSSLLAAPSISDASVLTRGISEDGGTLALGNLTVTGTGTVTATVTLTENSAAPANGTLTLGASGGLTAISGSGTGTVSFQGTAADVQAALNGLLYKPTDHFNGDAKIVVGLSNADGSSSKDINVQVAPVNDPPVLAPPADADAPDAAVVNEGLGNSTVLTPANFGIDVANLGQFDPDLDPTLSTVVSQTTEQMTFEVTSAPADGRLYIGSAPLLTGSLFTLKDLIDGKIKYEHQDGQAREGLIAGSESDSFGVTVRDGAGGESSALVPIKINPVNDAPTVSGGVAAGTIAYEGRKAVPVQVTVTDPDQVDATMSFTFTDLALQDGALYLNNGGAITAITNGYVFTGTQAELNSQLRVDISENEPSAAMTFKVAVLDDGGGAGAAAALSTTATITIDPRENNDHPDLVTNTGADAASPVAAVVETNEMLVTTDMLNVLDLDSPSDSITFVLASDVTNENGGNGTGYLLYDDGTGAPPKYLQPGSSFTLKDIEDGRISVALSSGSGINDFKFDFKVRDSELTAFSTVKQTENSPAIEGGTRDATDTDYLTHSFNFRFNTTSGGIGTRELEPANLAPQVIGIQGISANDLSEGGGAVRLWASSLALGRPGIEIGDVDNTPDEISIRVEKLPTGGTLLLNGNAIQQFGSFTYQQLIDGEVSYRHDGGEQFLSSNLGFAFSVSDGTAGVTPPIGLGADGPGNNFSVEATPVNDTPSVAINNGAVVLEGGSIFFNTTGNPSITLSDVDGSGDLGPGTLDNFESNGGADELYVTVTQPANGKLFLDGVEVVYGTTPILRSDITGGKLEYKHDGSETSVDAFDITVNDDQGAPNSVGNTVRVQIQVAPSNDSPTVDPTTGGGAPSTGTVNTGLRVTEGGSGVIGGSGVAGGGAFNGTTDGDTRSQLVSQDPDNSATQIQYNITTNVTLGKILLNGKVLGVGSSFTQDDLNNGRITYVHTTNNGTDAGDATVTDSFKFQVRDGGPAPTGGYPTGTFDIEVLKTNDAPVVAATTTSVDINSPSAVPIPGVSIGDPDFPLPDDQATAAITVFVRLSDGGMPLAEGDYAGYTIGSSAGASGATAIGGVNGSLALTGTIAEINAYLAGLQFTSANDPNKTLQLEVIADDRVYGSGAPTSDANGGVQNENKTEGGAAQPIVTTAFNPYSTPVATTFNGYNVASQTINLRISTINETPTVTVPGAQTALEDVGFVFSTANGNAIVVADPEASDFGLNTTVTLAVGSGTINVGSQSGVTVTTNGSGSVTLVGKVDAINTLLGNGVTYASATDTHADTNGAAAGDATLTVSLTEGDAAIGQGSTNATVSETIAITITAVNDAPVVAVVGSPVIATSSTTAYPVTGFSVADKDIADGVTAGDEADFIQVTVRLLDQNGAPLALGDYAGATLGVSGVAESAVAGSEFEIDNTLNGSGAALELRGTLANVNAALANLTVTLGATLGNADHPYRVEVVADDRMRDLATGALVNAGIDANGGEQNNVGNNSAVNVPDTEFNAYAAAPAIFNLDTTFREIWPSADNAPPVISAPADVVVDEDVRTFIGTGIVVSDVESTQFDLPVQVTLSVPNGTLSVGGSGTTSNGATIIGSTGVKVVSGDETGSITLEGSANDIQALLRDGTNGLFYQSATNDNADHNGAANGDVTVSMVIDEFTAGTTFGTAQQASSSFNITVNPVNDAPVIGGTTVNNTTSPYAVWQDLDANGVPTGNWHWTTGADATDTGVDDPSASPVSLLSGATVSDVDLDTLLNGTGANSFGGGSIAVKLTGGAMAGDTLAGASGLAGVASVSGGSGADLVINLTDTATAADVAAILNALTYDNDGDPTAGGTRLSRGFSIELNDGNNDNGANDAGGPDALNSNLLTGSLNFVLRQPPVANNDTGSADVTALAPNLAGSVRTNDSDPDHANNLLSVTLVNTGTSALGGTAVSGAPVTVTGTYGTLTIEADGSYSYALNTSDPDFIALDPGEAVQETFSYRLTDPDGQSDDATLIFDIKGADDAVTVTVPNDTAATTPDGDITDQVVFESGLPNGSSPNGNDLTVDANFTIAVPDGFPATGTAVSLGYTDASGNPATLALTTAQVEALSTTNQTITTPYGDMVIDGYTKNPNGTLTIDYTYTLKNPPAIASSIDTSDAFTVTAFDVDGDSDTPKTLNIKIVDDVPKAVDDTNSVDKEVGTVAGNVFTDTSTGDQMGADGVPAAASGPVSSIAAGTVAGPAGAGLSVGVTGTYGTVTLLPDGSYTYVVDPANADVIALGNGASLSDVFTYTITDADGDTSTATLTIDIDGNLRPVASGDTFTTDEDTPLSGSLVGNDTLGDGSATEHTWSKLTNPVNGTVVVNPDGTFVYTPNPNFNGIDSFTYTITDKDGNTSTATVNLTVTSVNDVPVAVNDSTTTAYETPVSGSLAGNDTPSGDGGNVWSTGSQPSNGSVVVNSDGTYQYIPNKGFSGTDSFTYTITDANGDTSTATMTITIGAGPGDPQPSVSPTLPPLPYAMLQPLNPLQGDQAREQSVFFDGGVFNRVARLSIPMHPVVYVSPGVNDAQAEREATDTRYFSDPTVAHHRDIESGSIGAGLGMDPVLYVQRAVRSSQTRSDWLDEVVNGRLSRISLGSDGMLPTPNWFEPLPENMVPEIPGEKAAAPDAPDAAGDAQKDEAEKPSTAPARPVAIDRPAGQGMVSGSAVRPAAAPSFSDQLRKSADRAPAAS